MSKKDAPDALNLAPPWDEESKQKEIVLQTGCSFPQARIALGAAEGVVADAIDLLLPAEAGVTRADVEDLMKASGKTWYESAYHLVYGEDGDDDDVGENDEMEEPDVGTSAMCSPLQWLNAID